MTDKEFCKHCHCEASIWPKQSPDKLTPQTFQLIEPFGKPNPSEAEHFTLLCINFIEGLRVNPDGMAISYFSLFDYACPAIGGRIEGL
jgi:hypothetical protein